MKNCLSALLAVFTLVTASSMAEAAEWATLKVKFVYDGAAPKLKDLDGKKDPFCANLKIPDERMVVGSKGELANVALIMDMRKSKAKDIHPDLEKPSDKPVELDNDGCLFKPHMVFVQSGRTLEISNSDKCGHNAKIDPFSNDSFNQIIPSGSKVEVEFADSERSNTTEVACTIHPWMKGHLIIRDHPYVGISSKTGELTIENLPAGEVTFKVVHENAKKSIDSGTVDGKKEKWSRGYMKVTLKPGVNDLGTIKISPDLFDK